MDVSISRLRVGRLYCSHVGHVSGRNEFNRQSSMNKAVLDSNTRMNGFPAKERLF